MECKYGNTEREREGVSSFVRIHPDQALVVACDFVAALGLVDADFAVGGHIYEDVRICQ
jgi:hypothetical protein